MSDPLTWVDEDEEHGEHKKVEMIEAKYKKLENLMKYDVFEEVNNKGQETISSRW